MNDRHPLLDLLESAIVLTRPNGDVVYLNRRAISLLGLDPQFLLELNLTELPLGLDPDEARELCRQQSEESEPLAVVLPFDKRFLHVSFVAGAPSHGENRCLIQLREYPFGEIVERVRQELHFSLYERLASVTGSLRELHEALRSDSATGTTVIENVFSDTLVEIESLLQLSAELHSIDHAGGQVRRLAFSLRSTVTNLGEALGFESDKRGVMLRFDLPRNLPSVIGDPLSLYVAGVVLLDVLMKACKPLGSVLVSARASDDLVTLTLSTETEPGVHRPALVAEPFRLLLRNQGQWAPNRSKLAFVGGLITLMNGRVRIERHEAQLTFVLELPSAAAPSTLQPTAKSARVRRLPVTPVRRRVMVARNEHQAPYLEEAVLESNGVESLPVRFLGDVRRLLDQTDPPEALLLNLLQTELQPLTLLADLGGAPRTRATGVVLKASCLGPQGRERNVLAAVYPYPAPLADIFNRVLEILDARPEGPRRVVLVTLNTQLRDSLRLVLNNAEVEVQSELFLEEILNRSYDPPIAELLLLDALAAGDEALAMLRATLETEENPSVRSLFLLNAYPQELDARRVGLFSRSGWLETIDPKALGADLLRSLGPNPHLWGA